MKCFLDVIVNQVTTGLITFETVPAAGKRRRP
jgi:hypothetical protein